MNIVYARGRATATEIHEALADPPTFSATRAVIRTLEDKGHLRHEEEGLRYVYLPVVSAEKAKRSALSNVVSTFFQGSPTKLMSTLLENSTANLSESELDEMEEMIRRARKEKGQ
jgi:predicted transcriptional regulator